MASEPAISKSDFAADVNAHPSRVTRWISERKIFGEALVGTGRSTKIVPSIAKRQLRMTMDVGQRLGNGAKTNLKAPVRGASAAKASASPAGADPGGSDDTDPAVDEQIKREKLREIQTRNRKAAAEEAHRDGIYMLASDHMASLNMALGRAKSLFEGSLVTLAEDVAKRHGTAPHEEQHALMQAYTAYRVAMEANLRKAVDACPKGAPGPNAS